MSALAALLFAVAPVNPNASDFRHGVWSGSCIVSELGAVCKASTGGSIALTFVRDSNQWIVSSVIEGCDEPQEIEKVSAAAMKSMLAIGNKAAAQVLRSMVNTRLLSAMMSCKIKRQDNSALNEGDLASLVESTNVAGL